MTTLGLAADSAVPLYRQLMKRIADDVSAGTRAPGSKLPSEREWADALGVSRITIRQALSALVQQGVLYSVPGKGCFVADRRELHELNALLSFTTAIEKRGEVPSSRLIKAKLVPAGSALAASLGMATSGEVVMLKRLRLANGVPLMLQESWLPHALCPGLLDLDLEKLSLYDTLRERYRVSLKRAKTIVSARVATPDEVRRLHLERPVVLVADQLTFAEGDRPIERSLSALHPARHPLSLVQDEQGGLLSRR